MGRIGDRYVAAAVLRDALLGIVALTAVFAVVEFLGELEEVGQGAYSAAGAVSFVTLMLPLQACQLAPAGVLIGSVVGLGGLAARNELVALLAGGISHWRVAGVVLATAGLVALTCAVGMETVAAPLAREAQHRRSVALSSGRAAGVGSGLWMRSRRSFIHVREVLGGGELRGVEVFEMAADGRLERFLRAASASWEKGRWFLRQVLEAGFATDGTVRLRRAAAEVMDGLAPPRQVAALRVPPEYLGAADLVAAVRSLRRRGESARRHETALLQRAALPADICVLALLALPLALGMGPRMAGGLRLLAGVLGGVGFQLARDTLARMAVVYGIPPLAVAAAPPLLLFGATVLWMRRIG